MRKMIAVPATAVILLALPLGIRSNYYMHLVNLALIYSLLAVSLNVVLGYTGLIALGHAALFGIGAYTTALLTAGGSALMFWPALLAAGVVTGLFGLLVGVPALRLKGHYLALATLGFGEIMRSLFFNWREMTNGTDGISGIPMPSLGFVALERDQHFYFLALTVLVVVLLVCHRLATSKFGRHLAAVRDAEVAAGACGVNVPRLKIIVFGLSAVVAGFAGALYASLSSFISPDTFTFDVTAQLLSMVLIGGIGSTGGPVLGAVVLTFLPEFLRVSKAYYMVVYGFGIAALITFLPRGLFGLWRRHGNARGAARDIAVGDDGHGADPPALDTCHPSSVAGRPLLEIRDLVREFGGVTAIDGIHTTVHANTVHAVIGPNGSGKSTLVNIVSGVYSPTSGSIVFDGMPIEGLKPWRIAEMGVVRTFQNLRLFKTLTVEDNVMVACRGSAPAGWGGVFLRSARARNEEVELRARAHEALVLVGMMHLRHRVIAHLPHEEQRVIEIARAYAMRPKLILLDEPAAGMNPVEVERLVNIIGRLRRRGITIVLIEHNMPFVMRVAERMTVLNHGRRIAEGVPHEVRRDPEVIKAYLGEKLSERLTQHAVA